MKNKNMKWVLYAIILVAVGVLTGVFLMNGQAMELTKGLTGFAAGAGKKPVTTVNSGSGQANYSCTIEVYTTTQEKLTKGEKISTPDYTLKLYNRNNLLRLDLPYLGKQQMLKRSMSSGMRILVLSEKTRFSACR
ncbi:MAG: hypothetical protein GX115_02095 [Ruminiclostridium sp.]|nr:hypothetical protein [Ruminiclostridium sp.]